MAGEPGIPLGRFGIIHPADDAGKTLRVAFDDDRGGRASA